MTTTQEFVNITIQDHTGDRKLRLSWDPSNTESAKSAQARMEEMFIDLQNAGYRFFTCKKVLGLFTKKGKEVTTYDPRLGELIYESGETVRPVQMPSVHRSSSKLQEVETDEQVIKYEEPKKFNPAKESIDTSRDYVATKPMRAG